MRTSPVFVLLALATTSAAACYSTDTLLAIRDGAADQSTQSPVVDAAGGISDGSAEVGEAGGTLTSAASFHCGSWADQRDNFVNGNLLLSGLSNTDDYATVLAKSTEILAALNSTVGANSVRLPINEPTVSGTWWAAYKGAIDAGIAQGMKVMVAYWAYHNGKEDDRAAYFAMWKTLVDAYGQSDLVYFEIFNNPYGYAPADFITLAALWLSTYPTVPRGRVIVAGSDYDSEVFLQGADSRLAGTLLSYQVYPFSDSTMTTNAGWSNKIKTNLGGYESRTIITAWGAPMANGADYSGTSEGDNYGSYVSAVSNYLRDNRMGSCYWPMLRTGDSWSLTTLSGTGTTQSLNSTNASGLARVRSAFNL
jgi:endoglucanase